MAFYDDIDFIVSHIRNSYVTSDDTGTCELVILNEPLPFNKNKVSQSTNSTTTYNGVVETPGVTMNGCQSLEIVSDMDLVAHRRRSNTAQRLDRLKKERQSQALIKHVQWRDPAPHNQHQPTSASHVNASSGCNDNVDAESTAFQKKDKLTKSNIVVHSLLAELLEKLPAIPANPFAEYARFAGNTYAGGMPVKKINIFLTMLPPARRAYPMPVTVVSTAKVHELVGLICWKYTLEKREPKLSGGVDQYSLHIAEDDGDVDLDFPCLDFKEVISKFGFSVLALVDKGADYNNTTTVVTCNHNETNINVTVHVAGEGQSVTMSVDSLSMTLADILDKFVKQNTKFICAGYRDRQGRFAIPDWRLAKRCDPEVQLDLQSTLASVETLEFCLTNQQGQMNEMHQHHQPQQQLVWPQHDMAIMEAPLYQSYVVQILNKVRSKTTIHLGISGEKIEIVPMQQHQQKSSKMLWSRTQKPISYDTEAVVDCDVTQVKSNGKTQFRLSCSIVSAAGTTTGTTTATTTTDRDYKSHEFETDNRQAHEIVQKINHILQLRLSQARRDYLELKERKALSVSQKKSSSFTGSK